MTFAAIWAGRFYVIYVDYSRFAIIQFCYIYSNKRKYVSLEFLTKLDKVNYNIHSTCILIILLVSSWQSVRQYVNIEQLDPYWTDYQRKTLFQKVYKTDGTEF